jgi:SAM-dependent methyltransferase
VTHDVYEEPYFRAYAHEGLSLPAQSEELPERYQERFRILSGGAPQGLLLEIGCGSGSFLNLAHRHEWAVRGIDVSEYAAERVRQRHGLDVSAGTLEEARFPDNQFDAVHMSHVLEHLPDPRATLIEIRRVMKPGGRLGIEVPNEFENVGSRLLSSLGLLKPYPVGSTHIWFFSPVTLVRLVSAAGLVNVRLRTFRDTEECRTVRRFAKRAISLIEEPLGKAPLIEIIASKAMADRSSTQV